MGFFSNKKDNEKKEVEDEEKTYSTTVTCDNCGDEEEYEIPVGVRVKDYLKDEKCEFCECLLIEQ